MSKARRPDVVIAAGCLLLLVGMGLQNSYAMFLVPVTDQFTGPGNSPPSASRYSFWRGDRPAVRRCRRGPTRTGQVSSPPLGSSCCPLTGVSHTAEVALSAHATERVILVLAAAGAPASGVVVCEP